MQGVIVLFGKYSLNDADNTLTLNIEGCSFPNLVGGTQKRTITALTADDLKYTNPMTTTGARSEVAWKRAR
jgi:Lipocalin-like domain